MSGREKDFIETLVEVLAGGRKGRTKLSAMGRKVLADIERQLARAGEAGAARGGDGEPAEGEPPAPPAESGGPAAPTPVEPAPTPPTSTQPAPTQPPATPTQPTSPTPPAPPAPPAGGSPPAAGGGQSAASRCCEALVVRLERIKVSELTSPGFMKDNVVVTGLSHGRVMNPSPTPFGWPVDRDGDIDSLELDKGGERTDTPLVARVEVGRDCEISLDCTLTYWEEDAEDLAELLQEAARQLTKTLAAQQGIMVPASSADAIRRLIKEIARQLGLTNDNMGEYAFTVSGQLHCDTEIDQLTWSPPWGSVYAHEKIDARTARLKRTFSHDGGVWETSIQVQMLCPKC
jgi:hypothetical protein